MKQMKKIKQILSIFLKLFDVAIAIYLYILLGYSAITGTEMSKIIDVGWWILLFVLSLTAETYLREPEEIKTEQE
jgi:ammonia channel protein AmtB